MAYIESVIIKDSGGTEADVTAANALKVDGSAVTQPVNVVGGSLTANLSLQTDAFQQTIFANRYNQIEVKYDQTDPDAIPEITVTKTTTGDASNVAGQALFSTGANTNGGVKAVTNTSVNYRPHAEIYAAFTAIWTSGGLANSYQRIGIYDANNGFFIGYEGTVFGITTRKAAADTQIAQASFNVDTLTGAVGSKYTRNGVPEAANFALDNLFRVRYGWLGAAPITWEIFSPDGAWVVFHIIRYPNTTTTPSIGNPDLPMTLEVKKNAGGATVLNMNTACWGAGTSSDLSKITDTITDNTLAPTVRSVIAGRSSTGGGTYYNVKVNPSGSLVTTNDSAYAEDSAHASGDIGTFVLAVRNDANTAMTSANGDYSPVAVNANGAIAINDGGNSITVDGTVAATQSGAWSVDVNNAGGASAVNIQDGGNSITIDGTVTLGPNSGVDIGDVDVTSVVPGTGATNLGKAEDTAHTSGDVGVMSLGVRNDLGANTLSGTNGDYTPFATDQYGKQFTVSERVHNTAHTPSDIGSFVLAVRNDNATSQAATSNNSYASISVDEFGKVYGAETKQEDTAHTSGQTGSFVLGVRNDSNAAMTSADGDYSPIAVNANGAVAINITADAIGLATEATLLQVDTNVLDVQNQIKIMQHNEDDTASDGDTGVFVLAVRNDANAVTTSNDGDYSQISVNSKGAVAINDGGNSITVDGTVGVSGTVTVSGTVAATQSGTWVLGANSGVDIGDVTINNAGGASAVNIQDGGNSITVDGTVAFSNTTIAVTNAGTFAVQAAQSGTWILGANSGVDIGDVTINNAGGASAVNIQDGGNSITVDGTVAATQSGTWILGANSGVDIGDVTINNASGASAVNIQDGGNSITVDGTVTANAGTGNFTVVQATASNLNATIGNASGASAVNIQDGGNSITVDGTVTVTPPTLTKGTQGATGFSTQDLKDAGRTAVRYYAVAAAAGTTGTETAITLTRSSGTSATTTGTSFTPTSGKTFRIQAISFATRGNATATIQTTTFNLRINTAGAVTTTSTPVILSMRSATPQTASAWDRILLEIPDGIEIAGDGTLQFGVTAAATYVTNAPTWDVTIIGFEY